MKDLTPNVAICAWCQPDYKPRPEEVVTHGICKRHVEEQLRTLIVERASSRSRANFRCRCRLCGDVHICTPLTDFYEFAGDPERWLYCATCFAKLIERTPISVEHN